MSLLTSLISYWKLDEASGNALDAHGSNDLTDTNTVGSAAGKISGARDFEVSAGEYFSKASNADLSVTNEDFTWAGWFQLESKAARMFALGKVTGGGQTEYWLDYDASGDRLRFAIGNGATAGVVTANNLGSPSTATWYYVVAWHDSVANTVNIQVNDGTADSTSFADGAANLGGNFTLGYSGSFAGGSYWDGLIDEVGFWKRVLTSGERTSLYNSGSGLAYGSFGGGSTAYPWHYYAQMRQMGA